MKTSTSIRRVLAAILAVMLLASLAGAAFAAENLNITIKNNTGLPPMEDDQFTAYQLFTGTPNKEGTEEDTKWDETTWNVFSLADIQWGRSIKTTTDAEGNTSVDLVEALKDLDSTTAPWAFGPDGTNLFTSVETAEDLARVLVGKDNAFLQAFSKFVMTKGDDGNLLYLKDDSDSKWTSKANNNGDEDASNDVSTITVPDPGYYLIVEKDVEPLTEDAVSEYILAVLGDQDIQIKASVPTIDKGIEDSDNDDDGDAAGIGDEVTFKLTGTLPKNFGDYDTYYYEFADTLSAGLTFNNGIVVTVKQGETTYTIDPSEYEVKGGEPADPEGTTTFQVVFDNLRKEGGLSYTAATPEPDPNTGKVVLTRDAVIYVTYTAIVNENAVVTSEGNPNTSHLVFSNDPNSDERGQTHDEKVYVYAFGLDLTKVGGTDEEHSDPLGGAGFTLSKMVPDDEAAGPEPTQKKMYAKFSDVTEAGGVKTRKLEEWVEEDVVKALIDNYNKAKADLDRATEATKAELQTKLDEAIAALQPYILTSDEGTGKLPQVTALDEGTYTLNEVITPAGYNTMDPFTFTIDAQIDEDGNLISITYTHDEEKITYDAVKTEETGTEGEEQAKSEEVIFHSGLLPDTLVNQKAPILPFTGGIGTTLFYVFGTLLILAAVVSLVVIRKKARR